MAEQAGSIQLVAGVDLYRVAKGGNRVAAERFSVNKIHDRGRHVGPCEHLDADARSTSVRVLQRFVPPFAKAVATVVALGAKLQKLREQDGFERRVGNDDDAADLHEFRHDAILLGSSMIANEIDCQDRANRPS